MSAGKGVTHAEFNLEDEATTLFQIWIESDRPGVEPSWGAMPFPKDRRDGQFQLLASGNPEDGTLTIHADARLLGANVPAGGTIDLDLDPARHQYLVASGKVTVNGVVAEARDGVAITGEARLEVVADPESDVELVLVDAC